VPDRRCAALTGGCRRRFSSHEGQHQNHAPLGHIVEEHPEVPAWHSWPQLEWAVCALRGKSEITMTTITTSIFDPSLDIVVNPVNTVGVMGKGLALEFKERYSDMYRSYRKKCLSGALKIGQIHIWEVDPHECRDPGPRVIINLPTKVHWRNPSFWAQIEPGVRRMIECLKAIPYPRELDCRPKIGIPRLGSGLGGLPWSEIKLKLEVMLATLEPDYEVVFVEPKIV